MPTYDPKLGRVYLLYYEKECGLKVDERDSSLATGPEGWQVRQQWEASPLA